MELPSMRSQSARFMISRSQFKSLNAVEFIRHILNQIEKYIYFRKKILNSASMYNIFQTMSTNAGAVIVEIDLKKKKLT